VPNYYDWFMGWWLEWWYLFYYWCFRKSCCY
jgi:hypothetical protein